ncbi:UNVERIFIED_CONTAM: hypothetical protein PYX00_002844 [Menopon gallinae]|uniref:Guanylate kinase-like domain-containing protein n=1 Tax=Menopon gallinae TaxID=328185 RepID=A0AAW2HZ13_9NEOP
MTRELEFGPYTDRMTPTKTYHGSRSKLSPSKCDSGMCFADEILKNLTISDITLTQSSSSENKGLEDDSDESKTVGSWDLPSGPVPWMEKDTAFDDVLQYEELDLTEEEENGLLTDRIVAACSSYLTRSPSSKCYIVAKLCLTNKNLNDIRIIAQHRFLQYVDLSWNNLKDLSPLGSLPYLMYLDVSHNLLEDVLRFEPPWNLTYVDYSYNEVRYIDDLSEFWSLSYLNLSHNKITKIRGLDTLRYLRHLDLSHNKIKRFENLNHMQITDLNMEYNLISSFEMGSCVGVSTMLNLNSLCLGNNQITQLDFLMGCYHIRKLELQNNKIESLLELSRLRPVLKLYLLDLSGNPVCDKRSYRYMILNTVPDVKFLDQSEVHLSEKVAAYLEVTQRIIARAVQNNWRMIFLDNLNYPSLNLDVLPVDQANHPFVVLVGPCGSGKKRMLSKLGKLYPDKIFIGKIHTTRDILECEKSVIKKIGRVEFEERIKNGQYYVVTETLGHYYGISRKMLAMAVKSHKLCLTYTDLDGALSMVDCGIQPTLVMTIPKSREKHEETLKKHYGPVVILTGAAYINKRELADSHTSNKRRVKEIIHDLLQDIFYWVEYNHKFCERRQSTCQGRECGDAEYVRTNLSVSYGENVQRPTSVASVSTNLREVIPQKNTKSLERSSRSACILPDKEDRVTSPRLDTDRSPASEQYSFSDHNVREEGPGTCSTSYSAVSPKPMHLEQDIFDDEDMLGEEDDLFGDWSSPFLDWDEINKDCQELEAAAEVLSLKFVNRVLDSRSVYMDLNLVYPGLFSYVLLIDDEEEAMTNLVQFLREIWRSFPTKQPPYHIEKDYAYKEIVPRKLAKLKAMMREDTSLGERYLEKGYTETRTPRTIITQMKAMGYGF